MSSKVDNSLDTILVQLGDFGKYQICVFSLVCLAVVLHSATHIAYVFTAMDVEYRCEVPGCDQGTSPADYDTPWLTNAVPFKDKKPVKCDMYKLTNSTGNATCSRDAFNKDERQKCTSFVYKTEEISILRDYNLQCDDNLWKLTMVGTMNNIGQFLGLFVSGIISDKYGRKVVLVGGMVACGLCGIIRTLMPTYELFLVFEFLDAAFGAGTYICGFVLGIELVGPKSRVLTGTLSSSCYAIGEVFVAGAAYLVQSWKPLIYIVYIPPLFLIFYLWIIPESIRWNLSKGRIEEAKQILRTVAKINKKELTEESLEKLSVVEYDEPQKIKSPVREVAKSTVLLLRLINCCFCWMTCTFLFYGLSLNSVALAGNSYMDFIYTSLVEIPAYVVSAVIIERLGRKKSLIGSYLLTAAACIAFIFIPSEAEWSLLSVYLIGKFGATAAFTVLYVLSSEIFPTPLRHTLMGLCSTFGRIGSMIAPQTPLLAHLWTPFPLVCFAVMSIMAGFLSILFPETWNKKLPDTVEEAENMGKEPQLTKGNLE